MRTALIVSGGGYQGLALVKALRAVGGVRVLVADCHQENVSRYFADAFFHAPMLDPAEPFLEFALALCEREGVTDLFAASSHELTLLDASRASFVQAGAHVWVSARPVLELAADKLAFYRWLSGCGVSCLPCFQTPTAAGASLPLIGKPRGGWGGRGLRVLRDSTDPAQPAGQDVEDYVWQPLLQEFDEYSIDFAIDAEGHASPLAFRRRIRVLGGFAILSAPEAPGEVRDLAADLVARLAGLGAMGPLNAQILHAAEGCWVSDLNPRIGTSMPLSLVAGQNPVEILFVGPATAEPPRKRPPGSGRTLRFPEERHVPDLDLEDISGVVFDLDDTLLDQKHWILEKLELTWERASERLPSRRAFLAAALCILEEGNRAHLIDGLCRELGLEEETRRDLIEIYRAAVPARAVLYDDALTCLGRLRQLGYRLAVLTDNPAASQRLKLEVSGLSTHFDATVLTSELGTRKPDARAFAAAARALGLPESRVAMIGDNLFRDIIGSLASGYRHAFHIQRPGGFFNFNPRLMERVDNSWRAATTGIATLREVLWHLKGVSK